MPTTYQVLFSLLGTGVAPAGTQNVGDTQQWKAGCPQSTGVSVREVTRKRDPVTAKWKPKLGPGSHQEVPGTGERVAQSGPVRSFPGIRRWECRERTPGKLQ